MTSFFGDNGQSPTGAGGPLAPPPQNSNFASYSVQGAGDAVRRRMGGTALTAPVSLGPVPQGNLGSVSLLGQGG